VLIGLADIASVHPSRFNDLRDSVRILENRLFDQLDFTQARGCAGRINNGHARGQNRRIFYKRTIRIL